MRVLESRLDCKIQVTTSDKRTEQQITTRNGSHFPENITLKTNILSNIADNR